jgi:hypothetical protein
MGERFDAMNIIPDETVLVSALTAVHQFFFKLDDTVGKIAFEKLGSHGKNMVRRCHFIVTISKY